MSVRKLMADNPEVVLRLLFQRLGIPYQESWNDRHMKHPDFPSFMSFHYMLRCHGIDSVAVHLSFDELAAYPMPLVVYIKKNGGLFLIVESVDDGSVCFISETGKTEKYPAAFFQEVWDNNALIIDTGQTTVVKEKWEQKVKRYFSMWKYYGAGISSILLIGMYVVASVGTRDIYNLFLIGICFGGLIISILFVIREFDRYNPLINRVCHSKQGNKKMDCGSLLDTKAAYFKDLFSWSDAGLVYFMTLFLILFFFPVCLADGITAVASFVAFPYVFYSVFYQKFVARKWCRLCLCIQFILLLLFLIGCSVFIRAELC